MLKNIIFDMGNVLIAFEPEKYIKKLNLTVDKSQILMDSIFHAPEWIQMDEGTLDESGFYELLRTKLPQSLHEAAFRLLMNWDKPLKPIEGMEELIGALKRNGYNIYLLSNASSRQHEYWDRIPASKYFDGTLISADVHMTKPNEDIYQELFRTFDILPQESFFIDDSPDNIKTAAKLGMKGYIFRGSALDLRLTLEKMSILM